MSSHSLADINADSRSSANTGMMKKTNHMEHKYIIYAVHFARMQEWTVIIRLTVISDWVH